MSTIKLAMSPGFLQQAARLRIVFLNPPAPSRKSISPTENMKKFMGISAIDA